MIKLRAVSILVLSCVLFFYSCQSSTEKKADKPAFNELVSSFTSGTISNEAVIQIQFAKKVSGVEAGTEASTSLLKFKPSIKGKLEWYDSHTLQFIPEDRLPSGIEFKATLNLPKLFATEKDKFEFDFASIEQNYRIAHEGIEPVSNDDLSKNIYVGRVNLADHIDDDDVEKIISAKQDDEALEVEWTHYKSEKSHVFRIKNIIRREKKGSFELLHNGEVLGLDKKGSEEIAIPSLNDFKVVHTSLVMHPDQHVVVTFSDPLDAQQNIAGLISINNVSRLKYEIDNNRVKVYPPYRLSGKKEVVVSQGIKNSLGYPLNEESRYELLFETPKPEISLIGKGNILPNSNGLIFPFKAVSLRAVEVRIIKIFESNVAHFLQVNQLSGDNQLRRAGRLVVRKTVRLDKDRSLDLSQWNTFSLDLTDLIKTEPGAIYRVELKMLKKHSIYPCGSDEETSEEDLFEEVEELSEADMAYWDQPDEYYSSYWDGYESYNWRERDDPCTDSYYSNKVVGKNILASDVGIIVKKGNGKEILVALSDLRTTEPLANAKVEVLSYQNQILAELTSDPNGLAKVDLSQKPFLVVVKHNEQRGYLKLSDGFALSYSRFDVDGQQVQKGMKGFIYGERGVWRPGDTIFVSFILQNKGEALPADHPVVFELQNPNGQIVNRQVSSIQTNHILSFSTSTSSDAPTGMWLARIKVGSSVFSKGLRIETVKPNRLKIKLDFAEERLSPGSAANTKMQVHWLHGAVARNLDATVSVTLNQSRTSFKRYTDYTFDDPSRRFNSEEILVFDGKLNELGEANIDANIDVKEAAPGMLKASFLTRVFEESGDFSVDRFSMPYAPYSVFVGVKTPGGDKRNMLLTDTTHVVDVVTLNADGKAVDVKNLSYYIYKVSWRWWWESSPDNLANYVGSRHQNLITSGRLSTKNGEGQFSFKIKYPDWGRYLVRVVDNQNGHATGKTVYVDWPGWAGKRKSNDASSASMLTFTSDKTNYKVGETATINFPSSAGGRALVSVENGKGVLKSWWVPTQENNTSFNIDISSEMTPNVYVTITLLQVHSQSVNDLPIRMYGVIPLMVEDPETHLSPVISMPDELRPEEEVSIEVSETNDKAMTYTLAMVEDGLLDLTRYKTPKPWFHFFAKEALGVRTWDLYDQVIGAYGGEIEQLFSIGGDDDASGDKGAKKANRFKPVVKYLGPFTLEEGETARHTFTMPRYIGSVRTMVIAASDNAFGNTDKTTPVRNPLMVLATLPRVLGPGEEVDLPVTVFAMKENIKNVKLELQTNNLFDVVGEAEKTLSFENVGEQVINFKVKVKSAIGVGKAKVVASSSGEKAEDEIELEVRNPNPRITLTKNVVIEAGKEQQIAYTLPGIEGTNNATLEVSNIPPIDFGRRLKYLLRYPHGCVEQTTSAAFPQLFLSDVLEQSDELESTITHNIKGAIKRLEGFMRSDGGLSYWPGSYNASDWGTTYAGHFLLEAELKGYQLPVGFKNKWLKYQKKTARQWSPNKRHRGYDLAQAYRLYTIALAGEPELSAMNRMRNQNSISLQARWRLAAAYALAGHQKVAQELIANAATTSTSHDSYTYGSPDRDKAMVIETLTLMKKREDAAALVQELSKALSGQRWMSTQTTAYGLLSISKFLGNSGSDALTFEWKGNGQKSTKVVSQLPVFQEELKVKNLDGAISVTNKSDGLLFARIIMDGIPAESDQTTLASNLNITINYTDLLGNAIDAKSITQGTDFMATVSVRNTGTKGNVKDLALTQIFPSGWEIRNTRMEDIKGAHEINQPDYRDYRDDRVYSYFDLRKGQSQKFVVILNASYNGKYYLPAVSCEAMYDNSVSARQPGYWVEVVKAGQ
ncbi:alpha-2-macroglobulin family protein [Carboxylicivirga sp. N1Y90]|uniref:alpha-2-macroglobulin family protein n=1 Tax=Carboxylicivirga fragile TaxID=3417571 RepID=UPI003D33877A|nr:alpha-2-macroglobulin [Marinilabiliaceae bacterium N1Y90]